MAKYECKAKDVWMAAGVLYAISVGIVAAAGIALSNKIIPEDHSNTQKTKVEYIQTTTNNAK